MKRYGVEMGRARYVDERVGQEPKKGVLAPVFFAESSVTHRKTKKIPRDVDTAVHVALREPHPKKAHSLANKTF